ncbi:hypothetical protein Tco_1294790 [Tanacetum coccineum]
MAHMALSDSKVNNDKSCSKTCLTNYEALKKQYDNLLVKLNDTGFKATTYKRGLATLEEQIIKYREHEVLFYEEITLLKRSVGHKEYQMGLLRDELEKVKQEKEGFEFKIAKFDKSAKDLEQLLASQITDKSKKGLEEFKEPEVNEYGPRATTGCDKESANSKENTDDPLKQHQLTDTESSSFKSPLKIDKDWKEKFFYPANHVESVNKNSKNQKTCSLSTAAKIEKPVRKTVRYAEMYRSQKPRRNQRNWNHLKSHQLGSDFVMIKKACYIRGSFDHLKYTCKHKRHVNGQREEKPVWKNTRRVNDHYSTRMTHSNLRRNMIPQVVLMRSGIKAVNTAKLKNAHNAVKRNSFNTVKASACWVWMPKNRVIDHVSKYNNASITLKRLDYIDAQGKIQVYGCTGSGEARVQQRKRRIQRRVHQKQKDQEDEVFGRILSAKKMKVQDLLLLREVNAAESLLVVSTEVNAN